MMYFAIGGTIIALALIWLLPELVTVTATLSATGIMTFAAYRFYYSVRHKRQDTGARDIDVRIREVELQHKTQTMFIEAKFAESTLAQMSAGMVHHKSHAQAFTKPQTAIQQVTAAVVRQPLLDALSGQDNILLIGGKGSGKTTVMQWLEVERSATGRTIIFDSHSQPAKWQGETIGNGRGYSKIVVGMVIFVRKMNERYKEYSAGRNDFQPVTNFIDEFTLLPTMLKKLDYNIQDFSIPILTEGRKVSTNTIWGSHSDRAESLGLKGAYDMVENFDSIVYLKKINGQRHALVNFGDGIDKTIEYQLPGMFARPPMPTGGILRYPEANTPQPIEPETPERPTAEEAKVIKLHRAGNSLRSISQGVYGSIGGNQVKRIKATIAKWEKWGV